MKKLFISALLMVAAAGCKSNPYCLNCKDSGNGVITPEDMTPVLVDGGDDGMTVGPDMIGSGGPCAPTNGGVEVCDGLDNDCNGKIDDVTPSRLVGDPKNCGACGNECKYPHAFGQCVGGFDGGMPMCKENGCQPGYIDLDGDPTNGCEYVCTPTTPATEVCDGKDNNCDGRVDEGFTATWFDAAKQTPKYDSLLADCGQCGTVCNLGVGTVMACQGTGAMGRGQCAVVSCFNGNDGNGVHQTYRHNPAAGPIATTGCEYHCAKPAATTGNDCNPNGACTFPAETCNGIDDDCNFTADDNLSDPGLNGACPDGAPGKLCQDATTCGKGVCLAGTLKCIGGGLVCQGSTGPSPETCNLMDDDCNGKVDDPYTATWSDGLNQVPRYDADPNNCGGCGAGHVCALPHGANVCRLFGGDTKGSCAILACNPGFAYVGKTDSNPAAPACDKVTVGQRDSTQATTGIGCFYMCGQANNTPEVCDAVDNDCDGCIDNSLTAPPICSTKGVCASTTNTVACKGAGGWKCTYGAGVDVDGMGNLTPTEAECDNLDNNCNGSCDENYPDVAVSGGTCNNPRAAKACSGGQGACQLSGVFSCKADKSAEQCTNGAVVIGASGDPSKATDEKCNGKDDDCDGLIDESTDSVIGATTYKGWHDPVAQIAVGADPFTGQAAHTVWVYAYEAARPDASATTPGSQSTRACANYGVLPWSNVTLKQAQAACAGVKDSTGVPLRVCSAWEWQQACNGNVASPPSHWSMSASTTTYQSLVCNDANETEQRCNPTAVNCTKACNAQNKCTCTADGDCPGGAAGSCVAGVCTASVCPLQCAKTCNGSGQCTCSGNADCAPGFTCSAGNICVGTGAWPTGSIGTAGVANQCYVDYGVNGRAHDLSGNLQEWTATGVTLKSGAAASIATGPSGGQWTVNGLTGIFSTDVGAQLVLSGATNAGNNGTFDIIAVNSATSVVIANPNGAVQAGATIAWKFIYNKVRGGNFATTGSGGDTCEFDFDIQKASFANTDVGFRCCADHAP